MSNISKRKQAVKSSIAFASILTILFALLLIYFSVPLRDRMNNQIDAAVTVKQNEEDRWAEVPGSLGYNFMRRLELYLYDVD